MNVSSNIDLCDTAIIVLTDVDCGSLTDPANGRVDHTAGTTRGQAAIYSFNTGYSCVSSRSTPTCQGIYVINLASFSGLPIRSNF